MDLMYKNDYVGLYKKGSVEIRNLTSEAELYFGENTKVEGIELSNFITDRIISRSRRDIDTFLQSIGLIHYDIHKIALATRLVNPMDGFWLRENLSETYANFVTPKLMELFKYNELSKKNTLSSSGQNIKYYSRYKDAFGVVKKRLTGFAYDTEAELAVFNLSKLLRVDTCPVYRIDDNHTFSEFRYTFLNESIIHMRHALKSYNFTEDAYTQIVRAFPNIKEDLIRMLILDYVTAQDDRHMSNYALCGDSLYPLYDNGRSLFWEDKLTDISAALQDVKLYAKSFGELGTYYNILGDISKDGTVFSELVNLDINYGEIYSAYAQAGYKEKERLKLITKWTYLCLEEIRSLDKMNNSQTP